VIGLYTEIFLLCAEQIRGEQQQSTFHISVLHSYWAKTLNWEPSLSLRMVSSPLYTRMLEYIETSSVSVLVVTVY